MFFKNKPKIISSAAVAGPKESAGRVGRYVDYALEDDMFAETTFERAERKMLLYSIRRSLETIRISIGAEGGGRPHFGRSFKSDHSASLAARETGIPYLGIYGACSTMSEGLLLASVLTDGGYAKNAVARHGQPLFFGGTAVPLSAGTGLYAAAAVAVDGDGRGQLRRLPRGERAVHNLRHGGARGGYGVSDVNNMGAAMAPAACKVILAHLRDTGRTRDITI